MHAVFKTGGKQYRAAEGDVLRVEKLPVEAGQSVEFEDVLMVSDGKTFKVGTPMLSGAKVKAEVLEQGRHKKVKIVKFRRRKHSRRETGHRQYFTAVRITDISGGK